MPETGGFANVQITPYLYDMDILNANARVKLKINQSIKNYLKGVPEYSYVYLHKVDGIIKYVGLGAHDRAVRKKGRSKKYYELMIGVNIEVEIISELLTRVNASQLEKETIKKYRNTCINDQLKYSNKIYSGVLRFSREGEIQKEYSYLIDVTKDGYSGSSVTQCCNGARGLHKNLCWMYKEDYLKYGFRAKEAINHPLKIQQLQDNIVVRELLTAQAFKQFGLNPNNIQQVCKGKKQTHAGYVFRYCK